MPSPPFYPFGPPNPCGDKCNHCPCLNRRPNVLSVTLAGFLNGECNCGFLNATFLLPYLRATPYKRCEAGNGCEYHGLYTCAVSSGGTRTVGISAIVAYAGSPAVTYWSVRVYEETVLLATIAQFYKVITGTNCAIDCDATEVLPLTNAGTSLWCGSRSGVTCQVN